MEAREGQEGGFGKDSLTWEQAGFAGRLAVV